jgi:hypothetical protein
MIAPPRRRLAALLAVAIAGVAVLVVMLLQGGGAGRCSAGAGSTGCATPASGAAAAPKPQVGPNGMPLALTAAGSDTCSQTVGSAGDAVARLGSAKAGDVICLKAGTYSGLTLAGAHPGAVTIQPVPGQRVTLQTGARDSHGQDVAVYVEPNASNLVIHGFFVRGEVELSTGDTGIRIDHNDITGGPYGIELDTEDCKAPNAPTWQGCESQPKIQDVVISGNRLHDLGGATGQDAINANNYANLRVTGNEITGVLEHGHHSDCFQSTFGGSGLVFDHNYEHDNNCQGFFVKDGDVTDALLYDNLFVRDQAENLPEGNLDIYNVYQLTIRNNTSWPSTSDIIRDVGSARPPKLALDHNVFHLFADGCCNDPGTFAVTHSANIFGEPPMGLRVANGDQVAAPRFANVARDDYRLATDHSGIGIDWSPADQHYGP